MPNNYILFKIILLLIIILIAVGTDLKTRKIYNKLTFPSMLLGLIINIVIFANTSLSITSILQGAWFSISGLLAGIVIFFLLFFLGWFGGGDAKLMGAIGSFMGPVFTIWCILFSLAVGGIFALIKVIKDILAKGKESQIILFLLSLKNKALLNTSIELPDKNKSMRMTYSMSILGGYLITLYKLWEII